MIFVTRDPRHAPTELSSDVDLLSLVVSPAVATCYARSWLGWHENDVGGALSALPAGRRQGMDKRYMRVARWDWEELRFEGFSVGGDLLLRAHISWAADSSLSKETSRRLRQATRRYAPSHAVTRRHAPLRAVTRRYAPSRAVTRRHGMLRDVTGCYGMLRDATGCDGMLRDVMGRHAALGVLLIGRPRA